MFLANIIELKLKEHDKTHIDYDKSYRNFTRNHVSCRMQCSQWICAATRTQNFEQHGTSWFYSIKQTTFVKDMENVPSSHPFHCHLRYVCNEINKWIFFFNLGTIICVPYPTRQVSKSWHTSDGVLPTRGRVQSHDFYFCNKAIEVMLKQSWLSQHMTSVVDTF